MSQRKLASGWRIEVGGRHGRGSKHRLGYVNLADLDPTPNNGDTSILQQTSISQLFRKLGNFLGRPRELTEDLKIATKLHFELIAAEDMDTETHGEQGIKMMDLGALMYKIKKQRGYDDSDDDDELKPAAKKARKNGGSDASHVVEDENEKESGVPDS